MSKWKEGLIYCKNDNNLLCSPKECLDRDCVEGHICRICKGTCYPHWEPCDYQLAFLEKYLKEK